MKYLNIICISFNISNALISDLITHKNEIVFHFFLMFLLLIDVIVCLKPVILLPPLYGTNLHATYHNISLPWYCPKSMNDNLIWIDPKYLVPPLYNCILDLLHAFYNNETDKVENLKGVDISIHDYGGDESVLYVDGGIFGFQFFDTYASMIQYFKSRGYKVGQNLFIAPYDWRMAPVVIDSFSSQMKELIEKAVKINGEKVTIMGYSCGGYTLQQFLTKKITEEWKHKYIEKIVLTVPSFGGSMDTFEVLFDHYSPLIPIHNSNMNTLIQSLPYVHSHLLNEEVYADIPVVRGPNGETYTAKDLPDLLLSHNKIAQSNLHVMQMGLELTKMGPADINMPTAIIYNTGYPTRFTVNFKNGWDQEPFIETGEGDGTIPSKAAQWACENWDHKRYPKLCIDFDNHEERFRHQPMTRNPFIHEFLFNMTSRSDWLNSTGRTDVHMPYIQINSDDSYMIRDDIRPISIKHYN